ncbi:uncharacterized protein CCOS01_01892 [Colletotrichum costaricense]|uniref:Xylanolytic transcriptional activator regulatory domain-containing protein n=1 Tax=Colletotrichum costaricense TaxID=1209916 RepID=A0AAJ0E4X4_9PEZI|nr:uncharacterized protein CCOS01_01892 [Colletotrichum costaricense]KAK1536572.1 hypothetical protein CCOS01_01892 [Colletotrichum costaricense]
MAKSFHPGKAADVLCKPLAVSLTNYRKGELALSLAEWPVHRPPIAQAEAPGDLMFRMSQTQTENLSTSPSQSSSDNTPGGEETSVTAHELSKRLGYSVNVKGTLDIVSQLGALSHDSASRSGRPRNHDAAVHYVKLVRKIPQREHINILVESFFNNVAWQYDVIDYSRFRDELSNWNHISSATLNLGPENLSVSIRAFPALLLQVLALALQFHPDENDEALQGLKYAPDIDFADLAADYSSVGHQIMVMLGSKDISLNRIRAGLMEAFFEKSNGSVIEAWHTLGRTIRDAQELGLHTRSVWETSPPAEHDIQIPVFPLEKKLWFMLHLWDAHMAVVLGRPMTTRLDSSCVPKVTSLTVAPHPSDLDDVTISPFDFMVCGYHAAYRYLQDIHDLGVENKDAQETVQKIHNAVISNISKLPAWATSATPVLDGRYPWLPAARETLITEVYFVLLALHRPFITTLSASRVEAHTAALKMLASQSRLFEHAGALLYRGFALVFSIFDAMVLVAATYIRAPDDAQHLLAESVNRLEWGLARLDAMRPRNAMAGFAYDVVLALFRKMMNGFSSPDPTSLGNNEPESQFRAVEALPRNHAAQVASSLEQNSNDATMQQSPYDFVSQDLLLGEIFPAEWQEITITEAENYGEAFPDSLWQLMDELT